MPSNPSESDPYNYVGDLESFVQDSDDSNNYNNIWNWIISSGMVKK